MTFSLPLHDICIFMRDCVFQEKAKAQEEYRRNRLEFRQFLESCGFIKVYTLLSSTFLPPTSCPTNLFMMSGG